MPRGKKFTAEQIIGKLREAEVGLAQGKTVPEVVRKLGVTEQTYYRWKREYGRPSSPECPGNAASSISRRTPWRMCRRSPCDRRSLTTGSRRRFVPAFGGFVPRFARFVPA